MNHQSDIKPHVPRQAIFKSAKNSSTIVQRRELIEYPAVALSQTVEVGENDSNKKITFNISGDALVDGRESFFSVKLKTNKWTAHLSSDVTSIIKRVTISLPHNQNLILEDISDYNTLASICHFCSADDSQLEANWYSGMNSLSKFNRNGGASAARRFLTIHEEGEFRTCLFQLNLSGILSSETYIPLVLLNGIKIDIHLETATNAFHYDPSNEQSFTTVFEKTDTPFTKEYSTMSAEEKTAVTDSLMAITNRGDPNATTPLTYTVQSPMFHAQTIFMSPSYIDSLIKASESQNGVTVSFDTFRMNRITPQSPFSSYAFVDSLQNLKNIYLATQNRTTTTDTHFNYFVRGLKAFTFRVGSRIYNKVDVQCPSMALASTLISLGKFGTYQTHNLNSKDYFLSKNVHCFDFQNAKHESKSAHSGLNTTNGRYLRLEMEFNDTPGITVVSPTDNSILATLQPVGTYDKVNVTTFLEFSKMIRINSSGILCTE